ncbi:hypothetical protein [Vibrio diazotrophicus]|uniref:hypothetical protein n=1 Tax=Vibrio diazotrophicus TaxID=685 RepID=UPI00142D6EB8|nr:hypothetical protein [Vibrio diazotrophicus]NIY90736.1 hypothetical protein [Vibrio diazotrophicus]
MINRIKFAVLFCSLIFLSGCVKDEFVTYKPKLGDEKTYQIELTKRLVYEGNDLQENPVLSEQLNHTRFKVNGIQPEVISLEQRYDYFSLKGIDGSFSSVSDDVSNRYKNIRQLLLEGFNLSLDRSSTKLSTYSANNKDLWNKVKDAEQEDRVQVLDVMKFVPMITESIPAKVGAHVSLNDFWGQPATLKVEQIDEQAITATIEALSEDKQTGVAAKLIIDRQHGWIQSLSMTSKLPAHLPDLYNPTYVLTHAQIAVSELSLQDIPYLANVFQDSSLNMVSEPKFDEYEVDHIEPAGDLVENAKGAFYFDKYGLRLVYPSVVDGGGNYYSYSLDKLYALDKNGQQDEQKFWLEGYDKEWRSWQSDGIVSMDFSALPLGWDSQKKLDDFYAFEGEVSITHHQRLEEVVEWVSGQDRVLNVLGINVRVFPLPDMSEHYLIVAKHNRESRLAPYVVEIGSTTKNAYVNSLDRVRSLISNEQFDSLDFSEDWNHDYSVFEVIFSQKPNKVQFYIDYTDPAKSITQVVQFVDLISYLKDTNNPSFLEAVDDKNELPKSEKPFLIESAHPVVSDVYGLRFTLPQDWQQGCVLEVVKGFSVNKHPVVWQRDKSDQAEFFLSTEDGIRRNFYNKEVTSELICNSRPEEMYFTPHTVSNKPWLIDVDSLNELDPNVDVLSMTIETFVQGFKFYNRAQSALVVLNAQDEFTGFEGFSSDGPPYRYRANPSSQEPLSSVLTDEGYLMVSGVVTSGKMTYLQPFRFQQQWQHSFPAFPSEQ